MAEQQGIADTLQLAAEGPEELPAPLGPSEPVPALSGYLRALPDLVWARHANG